MASPGMCVVVIEDDHHISDLVALYLRRDGFRVLRAALTERRRPPAPITRPLPARAISPYPAEQAV